MTPPTGPLTARRPTARTGRTSSRSPGTCTRSPTCCATHRKEHLMTVRERPPAEPRYAELPARPGPWWRCLDCGASGIAEDRAAHTRFHSILSSHAWSLAVLKTGHIAAHVHDKYDVVERIDSREFDSWSADAFAEVVKQADPEGAPDDRT